ncbi:SRPBCC family protein [Flavobacterium olei]|uniref:SRPBCC family protein n=1 Tax=Flavobacterium olei TaxID=1886782 RepID=UPI00321BD519
MSVQDFTTTIVLDQSPETVFKAIQNVRGWWSEEIEGKTAELNDEFNYHYEDIHRCKIKLTEVIPNEKMVWLIQENYFSFTQDDTEWTNTKAVFEISTENNKTKLVFTHQGLVPDYECYEVCKSGWTNYIQNSLQKLITTGKGEPNSTGKPQTETEKKLSER